MRVADRHAVARKHAHRHPLRGGIGADAGGKQSETGNASSESGHSRRNQNIEVSWPRRDARRRFIRGDRTTRRDRAGPTHVH